MGQLAGILGQPVRDIDTGRRQPAQRLAQRNARRGEQEPILQVARCVLLLWRHVQATGCATFQQQPRCGIARRTADKQQLAGRSTATAQRLPRRHKTHCLYGQRQRPCRGVAADQRDAMTCRQLCQPRSQRVQKRVIGSRQREAQ